MSRHRNVRSMNYEEECEHDDDIYGHSYDDHDYGTSPGTASMYLYDRSRAHQPQPFMSSPAGSFNKDRIDEEENDSEDHLNDSSSQTDLSRQKLTADEQAKLNSCLDEINSIMGESGSESAKISAIIDCGFDLERSLDRLLRESAPVEQPKPQRKPKDRNHCQTDQSTPFKRELQISGVGDASSRLKFTVGPDEENVSFTTLSDVGGKRVEKVPTVTKANVSSELNEIGGASAVFSTPKKDSADSSTSVVTPSLHKSASKARIDRLDVQKEYEKRKAGGKDYINLVVIGHVDAGKSTLMGHLLYQLGFVSQKTMHKFEQESRKVGKGSFAYAWVLDETEEERTRGVTMDIAQTRFETPTKNVTLLDAPGHKDFIPNMITGAAQADVAILVINATKGEFETGFDTGGQTREHTMLVRSLGVSQLIVAVNKMDTADYSKQRYDDVVQKLGLFLRQAAGFKDSDVTFIPCSGLLGDNLAKSPPAGHALASWYTGPTLAEQIDHFRPPLRPVLDKPLRMCVTDTFKSIGAGVAVAGTIQAGSIQAGDRVLAVPANEVALVKSVTIDESAVSLGFAGDNAVVTLTGIDATNLSIGTVLCDLSNPVPTASRFLARIVLFNINFPITRGFPVAKKQYAHQAGSPVFYGLLTRTDLRCHVLFDGHTLAWDEDTVVLHYQSLTEQAHIRRIVSQLARNTGEVIKNKPRCLVKNSSAIVEIEVDRPVCLELYSNFKDLGRFMLRSSGTTIAAGLVTEILGSKTSQDGTSAL